jgi:hypothetical protein
VGARIRVVGLSAGQIDVQAGGGVAVLADVTEVYLDLNVLTHSHFLLYEYVCVPLGGTGIDSCAVLHTKGIAGLSQLQV